MVRKATVGAVLAAATLFGWLVPLVRLFDAFQPMIVALSIVMAAILVRLNRGMPTLDWKSLEQSERTRLTAAILDLTLEYCIISAITAASLVGLVSLTVVGKIQISTDWPDLVHRAISAVIGAVLALCIARMGYVIWRDYDIVRLQKKLIDASGMREHLDAQTAAASKRVSDIRSAGLRKTSSADPQSWPE